MTIKRNPNASSTGAAPSVGVGLHGYTQDGVNRVLWPVQGTYVFVLGVVFVVAMLADGKTNHDFMYWLLTVFAHDHASFWYQYFAPVASLIFSLAVFGAFGWHIMRGSGETEYLHHWNYQVRQHFMDKYQGPMHSIREMYSGLLSTVGLWFIIFTTITNFGGAALWMWGTDPFYGFSGLGLSLPLAWILVISALVAAFILFFSHLLLPPLALFVKSVLIGREDEKTEKNIREEYHRQRLDAAKTGQLWGNTSSSNNGNTHP